MRFSLLFRIRLTLSCGWIWNSTVSSLYCSRHVSWTAENLLIHGEYCSEHPQVAAHVVGLNSNTSSSSWACNIFQHVVSENFQIFSTTYLTCSSRMRRTTNSTPSKCQSISCVSRSTGSKQFSDTILGTFHGCEFVCLTVSSRMMQQTLKISNLPASSSECECADDKTTKHDINFFCV